MSLNPSVPAPLYVGTCFLRGSYWLIGAAPNAMIMLKRVMPRVDKGERDQVRIKRTPEVDRLLQWFTDLHPLEMTDADLHTMHGGAERHREEARVVARVLSGEYVPRDFDLAVPPRDYQRVAADLFLRRRSLLLGDDTGVGKSHSAITALSDPSTRPALIVTPAGAVPAQWVRWLREALPGIRAHIARGTTPSPVTAFDVVVCPYHLLQHWCETFRGWARTVVFDEAQELRHHGTEKWKAAKAIAEGADGRLGLSATPTVNYGCEVWSVFACIAPGALGDREEFIREFGTMDPVERKQKIRDPRAFGLYLRENGLMLRRTRKDVGREMPPVTIVPQTIDANLAELDKVKGRAYELARLLVERSVGRDAGRIKMEAGGELDRIVRQATGVAKAPFIAAFVRMLIEQGEPVLLGLWHHAVNDIVGTALKEYAPAMYTGQESTKQKEESLRRFKARETPLLMMSLRSGAAIDGLQHVCRTPVIGELDWSHVIHHQFISRIDRDGQPDPVVAYYLISEFGSDPVVSDVCGAKQANSRPIINPLEAMNATVTYDPGRSVRLAEAYLSGRRA